MIRCQTASGSEGSCVSLRACPNLLRLLRHHHHLIILKYILLPKPSSPAPASSYSYSASVVLPAMIESILFTNTNRMNLPIIIHITHPLVLDESFTFPFFRRPISLQARAKLRASVCRQKPLCLFPTLSNKLFTFVLKIIPRFGQRLPDVCCPVVRSTTTTTTTPPPPELISSQVFWKNVKRENG